MERFARLANLWTWRPIARRNSEMYTGSKGRLVELTETCKVEKNPLPKEGQHHANSGRTPGDRRTPFTSALS